MTARKKKPPVIPPKNIDTTKRVEFHFPIHHELPVPKEIVPIPVKVNPADIAPLPIPLDLTHCEITRVSQLFGEDYLWLKVPKGFEMPKELLTAGQTIKADVSFSPPAEV